MKLSTDELDALTADIWDLQQEVKALTLEVRQHLRLNKWLADELRRTIRGKEVALEALGRVKLHETQNSR